MLLINERVRKHILTLIDRKIMRTAIIERYTNETKIKLELNIDGIGKNNVFTDVGFFDHMLSQASKHGFFDLFVNVEGDVDVDCHHTVEDVGIVFGQAIAEALGDKSGIRRYGHAIVPMDDALVLCAVDISGRAYMIFDGEFSNARIGEMDTEMIPEFFKSVCAHAGINIHIKIMHGKNNHHMAEAVFKAFGRAFDEATSIDPRIDGVLSTKGTLE